MQLQKTVAKNSLASLHLLSEGLKVWRESTDDTRTIVVKYDNTVMAQISGAALLALMAWLPSLSVAFYVPGVAPLTFGKGEEVPLKVNALTSTRTQIPRDYYRLPFCAPAAGPKMASENLGEFLTGNKIQSSPFVLNMLTETYCTKVMFHYTGHATLS